MIAARDDFLVPSMYAQNPNKDATGAGSGKSSNKVLAFALLVSELLPATVLSHINHMHLAVTWRHVMGGLIVSAACMNLISDWVC